MADRVALVTGGSTVIGRAIAHRLAGDGFQVVITGRNQDTLDEAAGGHENIEAVVVDVASTDDNSRVLDGIQSKHGRLDVLVNNAGIGTPAPFAEAPLESYDKVFGINVRGLIDTTQKALPMLTESKGNIVNISSVAGLTPTGSSIAYAVSKAGLIHLTRCMAVAMAPETLVNCVAPGLLDGTRATANLRAEQVERAAAGSLLKMPADKDDCADMVVTMCRTDTMTGQTMVIDSGRVFH